MRFSIKKDIGACKSKTKCNKSIKNDTDLKNLSLVKKKYVLHSLIGLTEKF